MRNNNNVRIRNYILSANDRDMFIYVPSTGETHYTDYDGGLFEIMQSGIFSAAYSAGGKRRGYLVFFYNKGKARVYFSHIVYCYYYRGLTTENHIQIIENFQKELSSGVLCVDHLIDGDTFNNTVDNLSLISKSDNSVKQSMSRFIKRSGNYIESFDGSGYRVAYGFISSYRLNRKRTKFIYCNNIKELLALRKWLKLDLGWNQHRIMIARKGELDKQNIYSDVEDYTLTNVFSELKLNVFNHEAQRLLNSVPRSKFIDYKDFKKEMEM